MNIDPQEQKQITCPRAMEVTTALHMPTHKVVVYTVLGGSRWYAFEGLPWQPDMGVSTCTQLFAGASPRLSPQQLREWFVQCACLRSGATRAGGAGAGGAGVAAGAGVAGGTAATGPRGARTRGTGAAGTGGVGAPPSDESIEPSGPYPELVGCLMYLMTCARPDLAYPLCLLACYVAPGRHRKVHQDAAKRVLHYLCSTSDMGLVLGGRGLVALTGHANAFWELRWLTYLLTDLGEQPCSPPDLYVDNKAMIALCQEHRLEHRTKHIALRYFLARELEQRGQLRLAYVATRANTADIFSKALPPGDHQRFSTVLGLVPTLPHLLTA
ncbi:unnamed protein product [Closterium sp. NIES-54]